MTSEQAKAAGIKGGRGNRGRRQSAEHIAKRIESGRARLAQVTRTCVVCEEPFTPTSHSQRYCSGRCWNAVHTQARTAKKQQHRISVPPAEYARLLRQQNGLCAICGQENTSGHRLAADHDHKTGHVRGLLCHRCNTAIGLLRDDPDLLQAAIHYLEKERP